MKRRVYIPRVMVDELTVWPNAWGPFKAGSCHLTCECIDRLHLFAAKIGLKRSWFQDHHPRPQLWHYDLTASKRRLAVKLGALEVNCMQAGRIARDLWRRNEARYFTRVHYMGGHEFGVGTLFQMLRDRELTASVWAPFRPWTLRNSEMALVYKDPRILRFEGEFKRYSFPFRLDTSNPDLILALTTAQAHPKKTEQFNPYHV